VDPSTSDKDSFPEIAVHSTEGSAQGLGLPEEEQVHFQAKLLDAVGQAVIATDTQGNVIYWNRAAEDLYGWSAEEAMGRSIVEVTPSEELMERAQEIMGELMAGKSWSGEFVVRRKDGTSFPAMVSDTPVLDEEGNVVAIIGVSTDITEIKETEELRRSEESFRLLVEGVKEYAIFMLDPQGYISSWNAGAQRINGYSSEEIIGRHFSIFYLPEDVKRGHPEEELRLAKEQGRYEEEGMRIRKDGSRFWASVLITALFDEEGNLRGFSRVVRDITERKEVEEERARRARYATLRAEVSTSLAEGSSLRNILQRCAERMVQHLDVAFARIWTLNEEENMLELEASAGMYTHLDGPHSRVPVGSFKIGLIAQEQLPLLSNDVVNDPRIHDKKWARREGMLAFAGYPLMVESRVVGVMAIFSRQPLQEDTIEALGSVADTIAQGIQRKRAVEALRESEERFRLLAENAQDLIARYRLKPTLAFEYVSPSSTTITGYTPEEYYADPELGYKIVHPDDAHLLDEALHNPAAPSTIRWVRKDGRVIWTEQRNKPIYDEAGELVAIEGIARDVTERKEDEEALRSSEEFFRALYENAEHPIFLLDSDLNFVDVNPYACRFYGYSREEFRRMNISDITLAEEQEEQLRHLEIMHKQGRVFVRERRHRKKNGRSSR
jgi:PAS domain S-box-containing protein